MIGWIYVALAVMVIAVFAAGGWQSLAFLAAAAGAYLVIVAIMEKMFGGKGR